MGFTQRACGRQLGLGLLILSSPTATAAQASLLPYFPTIMEQLQEFLVTGHEDLQPVRIQSLGEKGAPRLGSQCHRKASGHMVFKETSPRTVQVPYFSLKKAFPLSRHSLVVGRISEFPPASTFGSLGLGPAFLWHSFTSQC